MFPVHSYILLQGALLRLLQGPPETQPDTQCWVIMEVTPAAWRF